MRNLLNTVLVTILVFSGVSALGAETELIKLEALASFYADDFHGRPTASGELFDMNALTAAHKTLPFGTMLEITNLENGKRVTVRVNDRGPFVPNREIDLSRGAAEKLDMLHTGVARVSIRKLSGPEGSAGTVVVKKAGPAGTLEKETVTQATPVRTTPDAAPAGQAASGSSQKWRIQLASFSQEANATRFAVTLRDRGFEPAFEKAGAMIRVVIPGIADSGLTGMRSRLDNAGYTGYLVRSESR